MVYIIVRFKRFVGINEYDDVNDCYETRYDIIKVYNSRERAWEVADELNEKYGCKDYDNEIVYGVEEQPVFNAIDEEIYV